jgi:hypothetical protein
MTNSVTSNDNVTKSHLVMEKEGEAIEE